MINYSMLQSILNKKEENQFLTGTVYTTNPLTVKLTPTDSAISCIASGGLTGVKVGSRLVLFKYLNKYIAMSIITDVPSQVIPKVVVKQSSEGVTNNTRQADNQLVVSLEANKTYEINAMLVMSCSSTSPDAIVEWVADGTVSLYGHIHGRGMAYDGTNNATYEKGKSTAYDAFGDDVIFGLNSGYGSYRLTFLAKGGTSGGDVRLWWSQRTTDASNTAYVRYGSYIKYEEIQEI